MAYDCGHQPAPNRASARSVPWVGPGLPSFKFREPPCPHLGCPKPTTHRRVPGSLLPGCLQAYEKQRGARREEQKELQRAAAQDHVRGFLEKEAAIVSRPLNPFTPKAASAGNGPGERDESAGGGGVPQVPPWVRHPSPSPPPHRRCPTRVQCGPCRQGQGQSAAQLLDPVADPRGEGHEAGEAGEPPTPARACAYSLPERARFTPTHTPQTGFLKVPSPSSHHPAPAPPADPASLPHPYPQSRIVTCPMSGKPLRMSDLTPVRFTPLDSSVDRVGLITRSERYVCAVTRDSLSNATPCAVLRPS